MQRTHHRGVTEFSVNSFASGVDDYETFDDYNFPHGEDGDRDSIDIGESRRDSQISTVSSEWSDGRTSDLLHNIQVDSEGYIGGLLDVDQVVEEMKNAESHISQNVMLSMSLC